MLAFTAEQLQAWLGQFVWPFVRILALISASPLFSESSVPMRVKIGLGVMVTLAIAPTLGPMPAISLDSWASFWIIGQQIIIGVMIGFTIRITFSAVQTAGEFIGLQMGLAFASFFDPANGANTAVIARLLNIVMMLIFLGINGHLLMLETLAKSFTAIPVGAQLHGNAFGILVEWGNTIFISGLLLALPIICSLLTINLILGILNRAAPQISVFSVGFPATLLIGVVLLATIIPNSGVFLAELFQSGLNTVDRILFDLKQ